MSEEKRTILSIHEILSRAPYQLNKPFESDSELIDLGNIRIALTTDTLIEEISLFHNPYLIGWNAAMMSISDVLATGSTVKGLLISVTKGKDTSDEFLLELMRGAQACCDAHSTFILGGDLNGSEIMSITTTGFGIQEANTVMRSGARAGEGIFVTNNVGVGNLQALLRTKGFYPNDEFDPQLLSRITGHQSSVVKYHASSAIDTSDGLMIGLLDLLEQNKDLDFHIDGDNIPYHPIAQMIQDKFGVPKIAFAGGEVGDYGLLFTAPADLSNELSEMDAVKIGSVEQGDGQLFLNEKHIAPYAEIILGLRDTPDLYLAKILEILC